MKYQIKLFKPNSNRGHFFAYIEFPNGATKPAGKHRAWEYGDLLEGSNETQAEELAEIQKIAARLQVQICRIQTIKKNGLRKDEANTLFGLGFGRKKLVQFHVDGIWQAHNGYYAGADLGNSFYSIGGGVLAQIPNRGNSFIVAGHYTIGRFLCEHESEPLSSVPNLAGRAWLLLQIQDKGIEGFYPPLGLQVLQDATNIPFRLLNELDSDGSLLHPTPRLRFYAAYADDLVPCGINLLFDEKWMCSFELLNNTITIPCDTK